MIKITNHSSGCSISISQRTDSQDINNSLKEMYYNLELNYPKFFKMDNFCKLGIIGSELLYRENVALFEGRNRIGIILQNHFSSLDTDIKHHEGIKNNIVSPSVFVYTLPNIVIAEISIRFRWHSEGVFFIGKKIDYQLLSQYSNVLLNNKRTDINLVGWIEVLEDKYCLKLCVLESIISEEELEKIL